MDELRTLLAGKAAADRARFLTGQAAPAQAAQQAGRRIGAYTLLEPLGEGGMGAVWLAERNDGRYEGRAAVKLLHAGLLQRALAERFRREGAILAKLSHPHIARLLDAGLTDDGQPYLVLEHVAGQRIDAACDARQLGVRERIVLFAQVLEAVQHAHNRLVVHRDLKPGNVMVDATGAVKLLDFGIAKLLDAEDAAGEATALTHEAGRLLTPQYAAPEQRAGEAVTTATDVYALGLLLYELLTGQHPRVDAQGRHEPATALALPLSSRVVTDPQRRDAAELERNASARGTTPARLATALAGDIDNILAKALRHDAAERYGTVSAFADDLQRHLRHEPVSARPDALLYRATRFVRRHRWGSAATAAFVLAVAAGTAGTAWQAIEARRERDEAKFQAERALGKGNFVNLVLGAIGDSDRPLTQREILDLSVVLVEKQFGNDPRVAIDLLLPMAGQYMTLGDTERELAVMQRAAALAAASGEAQLIADVACSTVETEINRKRLDLAQAQLHLGLEAIARLKHADAGVGIGCLGAQADMAEANGDLDRALEHIVEAVRRAEEAGRTRGNQYPTFLYRLSSMHELRGDWTASFEVLKRRQRLLEETGRADTLDYLADRREEAVLLMKWGEYRAARTIIDDIGPRLRGANGGIEPPTWFEHTRGLLLWRFGELQGARDALRGSAERSHAKSNARAALPTEFALAEVLLDLGRADDAEAMLAKVERAQPGQTRGYRRLTPTGLRARLLLARGAHAQAARTIDAELMRIGQPAAKDSNMLAASLMLGARVHMAAGNGRQAQQLAQSAVGVAERMARAPHNSADVGEALFILAQAQRASGDVEQSAATAQRATLSLVNGLGPDHALTVDALALAGR